LKDGEIHPEVISGVISKNIREGVTHAIAGTIGSGWWNRYDGKAEGDDGPD